MLNINIEERIAKIRAELMETNAEYAAQQALIKELTPVVDMFENAKRKNWKPYQGVPGAYYEFINCYADPVVHYKGHDFSIYDVTDGLWSEFEEDLEYNPEIYNLNRDQVQAMTEQDKENLFDKVMTTEKYQDQLDLLVEFREW